MNASSAVAYLADAARRSPLIAFLGLTFLFTWVLLPFAHRSVPIGLVALFGPTVGAVATAAMLGRHELRELLARIVHWRIPVGWYTLALLLPLPASAFASLLERTWSGAGSIESMPISPLGLLVFVLVIGEEIGWRGFALPRLLPRFGPWKASMLLGVVWALWHLPLFFLSSMPQFGHPFPAFVVYTIGLSVVLTFLAQHTRGSVILATLFHGAVNTFGFVNTGATPVLKGWGDAVSYGVIAILIGMAAWSRRRSVPVHP